MGKKLLAQRLLKKWAVTVVLYWELERIYWGLPFDKLCIKSIKRGRPIKRQIVPLVAEKGYISYYTIQTAVGQFHSFH